MNNDKLVLQSAEPLTYGDCNGVLFYVLFGVGGLILGTIPCLLGGTFDILLILGIPVLSVLVGWGIRNKILKYRCYKLRELQFMVDAKPQSDELYQKLFSVLTPLGMRVEMKQDGIVSVYYKGIYYDVIYKQDDSFSLYWRQNLAKAILQQGYYISVFKKLLTGMGLIAYHVQGECLNSIETNYTPVAPVEYYAQGSVPQIPKKKSYTGLIVALICSVGVVALCVGAFMFFCILAYLSDMLSDNTSYADIFEEYCCDTGEYDEESLYEMFQTLTEKYQDVELDSFVDVTGLEAGTVMDEYMTYNSDYVGTPLIVEGEVVDISGDVFQIVDLPNEQETLEIVDSEYWDLNLEAYYEVDAGLSLFSEDDMEMGDKVIVVGMYCGKVECYDGDFIPIVLAIAVYDPDDYS